MTERLLHEPDHGGRVDGRGFLALPTSVCIHCGRDATMGEECPARLRADRDRLARILAVERGDASAAPEGWVVEPRKFAGSMDSLSWCRPGPPDGTFGRVRRGKDGRSWRWRVEGAMEDDDRARAHGSADSALEAMEAADAAAGKEPK